MALKKASKAMTVPFKFEKAGDTLKGYYQGQITKTINGSPAVEHTYKTTNGIVGVLGQANILNQFKNNGITPGTYVEITFSGQVQKLKGGRTMKVYDVSFDSEDLDSNAQAPTDESFDDEPLDEEVEQEEVITRPTRPAVAAAAPSAEAKARVQALLNKSKSA